MVCLIFLPSSVYSEQSVSEKLEAQYLSTLDSWVNRGGPVDEVQTSVVYTCSKLVLLTAENSERVAFMTTQRKEYDFRVDVCLKITANRVYPQPEFEKKEFVKMICVDSNISLFDKLCLQSGLQ